MYTEMPYWYGYVDGCPQWKDNSYGMIETSLETSGFHFYADFIEEEWAVWFTLFKEKVSLITVFEVGEPEDGSSFHLENFSNDAKE